MKKVLSSILVLLITLGSFLTAATVAVAADEVQALWGTSENNLTIGSGTLEQALSEAANNAEIKYIQLQGDIEATTTYSISGGNFTIDINSKSVTSTADVFSVGAGCNVEFTGDGQVSSTNGAAVKISNAKVAINEGSFAGRSAAVTIVGASASLSLNGAPTLSGANSFYGYSGVYHNSSGTLDFSGFSGEEVKIYASGGIAINEIVLADGYACYDEDLNQYASDETAARRATITVKKAPMCEVSFEANGGEGIMSPVNVTAGVAKALPSNSFTNQGFIFVGWNTEAGGNGTAYNDTEAVAFTEDTVLYAQWEKQTEKYTLAVSSGTGSGEYAVGELVTVLADTPAEGMLFNGWDGLDSVTILNGDVSSETVTFEMPERSLNITAKYSKAQASVDINSATTYYLTLKEAVAAASTAQGTVKVTVLESVSIDEYITIEAGIFTIDLNGKKVENSGTAFNIVGEGVKVTFIDSLGGGTVISTGSHTIVVGAPNKDVNSEVVLDAGTYISSSHTLCVESLGAKATVNAGATIKVENSFGSPVRSSGQVIIAGDNLSGGQADIRYESGTITLTGKVDGMTLTAFTGCELPLSEVFLPDDYAIYDSSLRSLDTNSYIVQAYEIVTVNVRSSSITNIAYEMKKDTHNTFDVTVTGRPSMIQFIEPDGGTRTYDRNNKNVTITSYDADGNVVSSLDRTAVYEIWNIYTNMTGPEVKARAKFVYLTGYVWEKLTYDFTYETLEPDAGIRSVTPSVTSGKKGAVATVVITGPDVLGVQFVMPNGTTTTYFYECATVLENGDLQFVGKAWINEDGTNQITLKIKTNDGWRAVDSFVYTVE